VTLLPHVERILDAARIAPSYDNMQPWRFLVEGSTVSFLVDHERDRSPANATGRMARIAVGAALECALLRAGRMGSAVHFLPPRANALVTLTLDEARHSPEPDKALVRRATNRHVYDGRAIDDATFGWLHEATPALDGARTLWFGRERVRSLAPIAEEGEALFYADARAREAALRAVRFDVRDREEVSQGMSVASLELSASDRMTLDALRKTPADRLVAVGPFKKMGARAQRLVASASGICVVATRGTEPAADVAAGRSMQRAWLALTRRGMVAQPMSALPTMETLLELDDQAGVKPADRERTAALVASFRAAFPSVEQKERIVLLLRFGWAPASTARVRRLPLEESLAG
jgi:nitroreductase